MINKILFTIFAVIAIWKAFSLISRLSKEGGLGGILSNKQPENPPSPSPSQAKPQQAEPKAVEMKPCPRCGAYVDPRQGCTCS